MSVPSVSIGNVVKNRSLLLLVHHIRNYYETLRFGLRMSHLSRYSTRFDFRSSLPRYEPIPFALSVRLHNQFSMSMWIQISTQEERKATSSL